MESPHFQETLRFLRPRPGASGVYGLVEPHLLYLSDDQSSAYLDAMKNEEYSHTFHSQTVAIIESHVAEILDGVEENVSLIDLGPGYPDKSLPLARHLRARQVGVYYFPSISADST